MKRHVCAAMIVAAIVLSAAGITEAASYPDMVGVWSGFESFVGWNAGGDPQFYYVGFEWSMEILDQDPATGNFYGVRDGRPFTGNVSTSKVVTIIEHGGSGDFRILNCKLTGKKLIGTMLHYRSDQIDTGTFTFYKQ